MGVGCPYSPICNNIVTRITLLCLHSLFLSFNATCFVKSRLKVPFHEAGNNNATLSTFFFLDYPQMSAETFSPPYLYLPLLGLQYTMVEVSDCSLWYKQKEQNYFLKHHFLKHGLAGSEMLTTLHHAMSDPPLVGWLVSKGPMTYAFTYR